MNTLKKVLNIDPDSTDSLEFITIIESIISNLIVQFNVDDICIIKVKNWFDHKWLNYSGKSIIHFEETTHPDKVAITNNWKKRITIPPFNPNRILYEKLIQRKDHSNPRFEKLIHNRQRSTDNSDNYVYLKSDNGLLVWYSSNSKVNNQGSLMVYRVDNDSVDTWYASYENKGEWIIRDTKSINQNSLKKLMN